MNIAVLGPSPVPFTVGGVENLLWGLCETINQKTSHQAELIKLPSKEQDFWSLIENYYTFYKLDLSHFDVVICTKYPVWMIEHPNCIYYIQHRLRGLYDTYHFTNLPTEIKRGNQHIDAVLDYMKKNPVPKNLNQYFEILFDLKKYQMNIPKEFFDFPAPFIRQVLHYLDSYAVSKNGTNKFYAISKTVKNRKEYFPSNANVNVIYHPSFLKNYTTGEYKHIFIVSRLDSPKRIDMLLQAMQYVKSDIRLYIAGTGPQEKQLKEMAKHDDRIKFLGFINDEEVERYYADSLVIPYFPYDEDYGLITIEAMMHKKPVITTKDSGGPTEFVVNGETGFCTSFNAKAIGEKIDYLVNNPIEAERMGLQAYEKVKDITWENTVNQLLEGLDNKLSTIKKLKRKKLTVTSTFPIYPPQGGGQSRIFNLYKNVAKEFDVEILSFTNADQREYSGFIAENLNEIRVPKSEQHQQREWNEFESKVGMPVSDITMLSLSGETPKYSALLKESIIKSDLVIISHPYLYYEAKKHLGEKNFIYEAHNVESEMKRCMLPTNSIGNKLAYQVFEAEKECCEKSELIMTCSYEDKETLSKIYNIPLDKIIVVPNGVDCEETYFTSVEKRLENKINLDLENEKIGLFMGSWHGPNLEACEKIFEIATKCPDVKFLLMGSQCYYFKDRSIPGNVGLLGVVSPEQKCRIFETVDFALNPMLSGSGTNLKMFDYMAAGIPIITTEFGTRGIDNKSMFKLSEIADMYMAVNELNLKAQEQNILLAREYVEQTFDWQVIACSFTNKVKLVYR